LSWHHVARRFVDVDGVVALVDALAVGADDDDVPVDAPGVFVAFLLDPQANTVKPANTGDTTFTFIPTFTTFIAVSAS
jgi:hypothetical protein